MVISTFFKEAFNKLLVSALATTKLILSDTQFLLTIMKLVLSNTQFAHENT